MVAGEGIEGHSNTAGWLDSPVFDFLESQAHPAHTSSILPTQGQVLVHGL